MSSNEKISLESLREKYRHVICYPIYKTEELEYRLKELKKLNIEAVEFKGKKHVYNIPVLGKGCVGIVVTAYIKNRKVALKIRRTDANRPTMQHEAQMLDRANKISVGPRMLGITKNFLLMEYVEGILFPEWIKTLTGKDTRKKLCHVLHLVLEQAWRLDKTGLDHGELSHAPKHIIVTSDNVPCLVDFETASGSRHVSNVTSLSQYLFIESDVAQIIRRELGNINKNDLVGLLRIYKKNKKRDNFENFLAKCNLL